ncbi:MAG TPA: LuxR C-terminal-related transcriptional regulator [Labilithrix sp.]|nr:LuxR C-terminal-related transcriptional regulator [Labilithrix sp.]
MGQVDPLRIVEAAYAWTDGEEEWLDGIAFAATPYSTGGGVIALTVTCSPRPKLGSIRAAGGATDHTVTSVRRFCDALHASVAPSMFAPTEFVGNAGFRLERLAKGRKTTVAALTKGMPLPPMWAVLAGAPEQRALVLGFPADEQANVTPSEPFPRRESRLLGLVGAHLGAALRLRILGARSIDAAAVDESTDAVLSPSGRILHATEGAKTARVRESLSEAVLRSERARGRLRHVDSTEATELWSALVGGRWSIIEATERDGKRFLLARKNALRTPDLLALTKEESDVVWLIAQGHSHKYVAYELGLSVASILRRLRSAMLKLRVGSRRDLLRKLGLPKT